MSVNRERQMVLTEQEGFDISDLTLGEIATRVAQAIEDYGAEATVDDYTPLYSDTSYPYIWAQVPETDEAMTKRIAQQERYVADSEARERKEYERLQAKFG